MNKKRKIALLTIGLLTTVFAATSCTANFCTNVEKARIAYALEPGVTDFEICNEAPTGDQYIYTAQIGTGNVYRVVKKDGNSFTNSSHLNTIIENAKTQGIVCPSDQYFYRLDEIFIENCLAKDNSFDFNQTFTAGDEEVLKSIDQYFKKHASEKYYDSEENEIWGNYEKVNDQLRIELGYENAASIDFEKLYISSMNASVDTFRSCITTIDGEFGNIEGSQVYLEKITWKQAWGKGGKLIEGLIVYPVAWLVDTFARIFSHNNPANYANGVPQLLSLILVTVIVRLFIFLVTLKSTLSQQKMSALQPELARIQQKYPNANTNQSEKQRLAEEQMRLYKKHKINPLSQLLVLIIQFPVFIGVWGAMTGSAVLSTGAFADLDLSQSIWTALRMGPKAHPGWWTALILIILMSAGQFFSMKVPQWIQKARTKKVARLGKNPAQSSQNKTANIVSYVMLVMIIIMGFTLPAAMGVYWFIGAIVSLIQTIFTQVIFNGSKRKK